MSGDSDGPAERRASADPPVGDADAWWIYRGAGGAGPESPLSELLPPPPPWRDFDGGPVDSRPAPEDETEIRRRLGAVDALVRAASTEEVDMVNAALYLRRPLIVTGPPGIGKSSLAHRVSRELGLGRVLRWTVTSRSTLREGLYAYDAIGRVQEAAARGALHGQAFGGRPPNRPEAGTAEGDEAGQPPLEASDAHEAEGVGTSAADEGLDVGEFVQLGPLGTALLPREVPRVLLIDEFDKADMDLANDLLSAFEEGEFVIPELARLRRRTPDVEVQTDDPDVSVRVRHGRVRCRAFPFIVITSNGERSFPPAFVRRCLTLEMPPPDADRLTAMLAAQFGNGDGADDGAERAELVRDFLARSMAGGSLAADQLLNAEYLRMAAHGSDRAARDRVLHALWRRLGEAGPG